MQLVGWLLNLYEFFGIGLQKGNFKAVNLHKPNSDRPHSGEAHTLKVCSGSLISKYS